MSLTLAITALYVDSFIHTFAIKGRVLAAQGSALQSKIIVEVDENDPTVRIYALRDVGCWIDEGNLSRVVKGQFVCMRSDYRYAIYDLTADLTAEEIALLSERFMQKHGQ